MHIDEAIRSRRSVRAFLDTRVAENLLRDSIELAARAASGGNLQPWRIVAVTGDALADIRARVATRLTEQPDGEPGDYEIYPPALWEPHRTERFAIGESLYDLLGIAREDKAGRKKWFERNFDFFGAPVGLFCFVDRRMGRPQWSDLGMYLQTLMLVLRGKGLDSCAQECWSLYNRTIASALQVPPELMLFCGMAIGYADNEAAANRLQTRRLSLDQFAEFHGF
ncbi:MAG: nfnB [Hydrocarboniphaga sp.]|uniref:nitroreductase n=1 Tax=Hydrocarboniphaga sp. TaxID=2033016 RepID=UPI00262138A7|nr:nitroreductase [Hydrocarboniphaga sp.]MDB5969984.1 nfnB [Hydrocarboniphaga sp.]